MKKLVIAASVLFVVCLGVPSAGAQIIPLITQQQVYGNTGMQRRVQKHVLNVQEQQKQYNRQFRVAAQQGNLEIVKALSSKANINSTNGWGKTALMLAAENGHAEVVSFLLQVKADPTVKTRLGRTAKDLALKNGHTEIARTISYYMDPQLIDSPIKLPAKTHPAQRKDNQQAPTC